MTADHAQQSKTDSRPIVCGTDFSATAAEALDIAAAIARRLDTTLVLVHVEQFTLFEALTPHNQEELDRVAARLRAEGTSVEEKLLSGPVFEELVNAATERNAQLIVVGAVGHKIARRLLVGSVAERVAQTAPMPTLVVRPGSTLSAWLRGEHVLKILAGYDFTSGSDAALRWLQELRALARCQVTVTHIDWPPEAARRFGYRGCLPLTENPAEIQGLLERDFRERVTAILPPDDVSLSLLPGWGRADAQLIEMANQEHFDLIVVGTHRRRGLSKLRFGSVSRGVLHDASTSVGVVPATELDRRRGPIPVVERVLIATDFSRDGNEAARYGSAILRRGGNFKLIHVLEFPTSRSTASAKHEPADENLKLLNQLRSLAAEIATDRFDHETEIIESGNAAEAIAQEAERFDADVICLGSHGESGLTKALLGSVAQGVMSRTRRPVLVVRARE